MPLYDVHEKFIHSAISYLFDLPTAPSALINEISKITTALLTPASNDYALFSRVFHNPCLMSHIEDEKPLTLGEAREYMIHYIDTKITRAAMRAGVTPRALGWDQNTLLTAIQTWPDHHTNLVSAPSRVAPWEWWNVQENQTITRLKQHESPTCSTLPSLPSAQEQMRESLDKAKLALQALQSTLQRSPSTVFPSSKLLGHYPISSPTRLHWQCSQSRMQ